jgi:RNA polymerase sigma-70 factor (ECF subfamily)
LRDYEGYSYQEIAEISGLSEDQVKVYIFRARKFLKAYIGKVEILI